MCCCFKLYFACIDLIIFFFIVVQVQLSTFPHPPFSPAPVTPSILPTLWLCLWVLYTCSLMTLPLLSPLIPPSPSPLVTAQFVLYFHVSGYILLACFVNLKKYITYICDTMLVFCEFLLVEKCQRKIKGYYEIIYLKIKMLILSNTYNKGNLELKYRL